MTTESTTEQPFVQTEGTVIFTTPNYPEGLTTAQQEKGLVFRGKLKVAKDYKKGDTIEMTLFDGGATKKVDKNGNPVLSGTEDNPDAVYGLTTDKLVKVLKGLSPEQATEVSQALASKSNNKKLPTEVEKVLD